MKLACIVHAHRGPHQVALLLSALHHGSVRNYLHLDRRVEMEPFSAALRTAAVGDVELLPRADARWGGLGIVDASLDGLAKGLSDGCDYFVLISGQDFPLRPMDEILAFFATRPRSYVESFPLPAPHWRLGGRDRTDFYTYDILRRRETCVPRGEDASYLNWKGRLLNQFLRVRGARRPRRGFPAYARAFGGSQWWNLDAAAARYVLDFVDAHPDYRRYHEHSLLPDEIFFQSILLGSGFAERHEVVNDALRFMIWEGSHPRILTAADVPAALASGKLFARKFDFDAVPAARAQLREAVAR